MQVQLNNLFFGSPAAERDNDLILFEPCYNGTALNGNNML
jgi:hypothetical protein